MERVLKTGYSGSVNSVALSQDGWWIVSGSHDNIIHIRNATTGAVERVLLIEHTGSINSVAFSLAHKRNGRGSIGTHLQA